MDNEKLNKLTVQCRQCGGKIDVDVSQETAECPFCGNTFAVSDIISESDAVRIEKIKQQAYKDVEKDKLEHEAEKLKLESSKESLENFKKGKLRKVLLVFSILSFVFFAVSFKNGRVLASIISLVQFALFTGSWAMGMQLIKEPKKGVHIIMAIAAFVLLVPFFSLSGSSSGSKSENIEWEYIELGDIVPQPSSNKGNIYTNSEDSLNIKLEKISENDYRAYAAECEDFGFTIDKEKTETSFLAYNDDGFKLSLFYSEDKQSMDMDIDAPEEMTEIQWPKSELAQLLPIPKSTYGIISWDNSNGFLVKIGNTSADDFKEYSNQCYDNGFSVDYERGDDFYYAYDSNGNYVSIRYGGFNTMTIEINAKDENAADDELNISQETEETTTAEETTEKQAEETTTAAAASADSSAAVSADVIRPEFKAAMDSYEEFFDEYVTIMKKYKESNGTDLSILSDYSSYMSKYADMMTKLEAMENDAMSSAETAYYIEVLGRINTKLLEVAQ